MFCEQNTHANQILALSSYGIIEADELHATVVTGYTLSSCFAIDALCVFRNHCGVKFICNLFVGALLIELLHLVLSCVVN